MDLFFWQKMLAYWQRLGGLRSDLRLGPPTTADGFIPACYRYGFGDIAYYLSHVVITRKRKMYTPEKKQDSSWPFRRDIAKRLG